MSSKIKLLIKQGEGLQIEFKKCEYTLGKDVFETVCAFLNRSGGELLLGVSNEGKVIGVDKNNIEQIKKDFVTTINNPQKITPAFYLSFEEIMIGDKIVLYVYVPQSSQVHRCNGRIFDRNEDGDFDITDNTNLVTAMYLRKQTTYSENRVYPFVRLNDFRKDLLIRVRKMAANRKPDHPWESMDDMELLKSSQLYLKDYQSGKEGFTLASVVLLGKDEVILSVIPHFRTDAILRIENLDRYDDRDDIRTNLLESYDRIMAFAAKHLPDKFYLEKDQNINVRDRIIREIAGNILIHREYLNPFPAKFIIEKSMIYAENSNKPHGHGLIDPSNFSPFPKNPIIAKFFKEIGRADELGSGVRNLFKYSKIYSGHDPQLIEGDVFKTIILLLGKPAKQDGKKEIVPSLSQVCPKSVPSRVIIKILKKTTLFVSIAELMKVASQTNRTRFRNQIIRPLIKAGLISMANPKKPRNPKQKYIITEKGKAIISKKPVQKKK
jgi:ATP-dependent DNA helicase RecG